jgi:hypothetical protein
MQAKGRKDMRGIAACGTAILLLAALGGCGGRSPQGENKAAAAPAAPAAGNAASRATADAAAPKPAAGNAAAAAAGGNREEGEGSTTGRELSEDSANLDFIAVNRTGQTIVALSISPAGEESWTPDILVPRELPPDERGAASFARDVEICEWDVRATFQGGHRQSWPRVNLCDTLRVELR